MEKTGSSEEMYCSPRNRSTGLGSPASCNLYKSRSAGRSPSSDQRIRKKVETHQENITKIEAGLANFERLGKSVVLITRTTQGRTELLRVKIQEIAMAAERQSWKVCSGK